MYRLPFCVNVLKGTGSATRISPQLRAFVRQPHRPHPAQQGPTPRPSGPAGTTTAPPGPYRDHHGPPGPAGTTTASRPLQGPPRPPAGRRGAGHGVPRPGEPCREEAGAKLRAGPGTSDQRRSPPAAELGLRAAAMATGSGKAKLARSLEFC